MKGFRVEPKPTKAERIDALEQQLQQLATTIRIQQMIMQKTGESVSKQAEDMFRNKSMIHDVQYRTLAMIELDRSAFATQKEYVDALDAKADQLRLKDYNEMSDLEDKAKSLVPVEQVDDESTVIITTTTGTEPDRGIFRAKFRIAEAGIPNLADMLRGKKVGDRVEAKLNGEDHLVEIVGIRKQAPAQEPAAAASTEPAAQ